MAYIWLAVEAFRQSIWWLLIFLFVPFGSVIFIVLYWRETKNAVFLQIAGLIIVLLPIVPQYKQIVKQLQVERAKKRGGASAANGKSGKGTVLYPPTMASATTNSAGGTPDVLFEQKRMEYNQHRADLDKVYSSLTAQRASLKSNDPEALKAFNEQASQYQAQLQKLQIEKEEIEKMKSIGNKH